MEHFDLNSHIIGGLFLALLGIVTTYVAYLFSFFHIPSLSYHSKPPIKAFVLGIFLYPLLFAFSAPFFFYLLPKIGFKKNFLLSSSPLLLITTIQLITFSSLLLFLIFFSMIQKKATLKAIWKDPLLSPSPLFLDFTLGILTWIISFPVIASISQFSEILTYLIFNTLGEEQLAVRYLKAVSSSPPLLTIALILIIFIAPLIEETAFRGFLQTFLKRKIGLKKAVILSALIFSLFHLSPEQGVGNIPLVSSLFVFSLYLGFLYERQRSLIAPIALHMTFNSVTAARILLMHT